MSVLRSVKESKRTKAKRLGEVKIIEREVYDELEIDTKVELIRSLIPLDLMHVHELLDQEVCAMAGKRYSRKNQEVGAIYRYGSNPGSVRMAGQRVPIRVPRLRKPEGGEISLSSYAALSGPGDLDEYLLKRVLYGISCRNYKEAAEAILGAIGLSSSSVSRSFIKASAAKLKQFQERNLRAMKISSPYFWTARRLLRQPWSKALGISIAGEKRLLGFIETDTENAEVLTPFLRSLIERGLDISQGLLVIIDGSKGLRAAVDKALGKKALVQRCQWHTKNKESA